MQIRFGTGDCVEQLHPRKIYGIDIDERRVKIAKKKQSEKFRFQVGDAVIFNFKDHFYDGIFNFGVIHRIFDWKTCFKEMYRLLKKWSILYRGIGYKANLQFITQMEEAEFTLIKKYENPLGLISYLVIGGFNQQ